MPVSVDTSPEKFDEPSDEQIRLNDVFTKDCPWLDRLFIQRGPLHSEKTRTLRGSLGDVWAVASFCELMAAMNLEETGLTLRVTSKYLVNGGWEKPYSANHSGALRPARLLELQQKSMVQLLPSNLRDFTSTFKASSLLIDNFLKAMDTDTLKDGQGLLLTGVSVLFGYNTSVNYSFHSDKAANPKQSDTDITCICMLGPGKSTFYVAGAEDEAVFEKPGDFHAFPSSLYHRSGQATSLTVKLVFFFKVKWPGMKDEEDQEEEVLMVDEEDVKVVEDKGYPEVKDQDQTPAKAADEGAVAEEAAAVEGEAALIEGAADKGAHGEEEATKRVNVKDEAAAGDATEADVAKKDGSEGAATVKDEEVRPPEGAAAVEAEEALIEGAADKGAHGEEEATKRVNVKDEAAAGDATEADVAKKDGSEGAATVKDEEVRPPEGAAAVEAEEALIEGAADKGAHREVEANEGGAVNEEEAATGPDAKGDKQAKPKKRKR